jgi:hypothetical protein
MLPIREVERYLESSSPELRDIVLQIRDLVWKAAPSATETIRRRDILYYYPERGGPVSAGICLVSLRPDHVILSFIHGAFLPDPAGLLRGESRYKRYVCIETYDGAPWEALQDLIAASASFNPRTLGTCPDPEDIKKNLITGK